MDEYKELLAEIGIEGEYEGIGHRTLGYAAAELPKVAPRKENHVFWIE